MLAVTRSRSTIHVGTILLTVLLASLLALASGCCGPRGCGPQGCPVVSACPPHGQPHHFTCPVPRQYAEPQWPYYDPSGTPRIMGDTRLRSHLGVSAASGEVAE